MRVQEHDSVVDESLPKASNLCPVRIFPLAGVEKKAGQRAAAAGPQLLF